MGRKRLDGIGPLTKAQKNERDARATYWMNQRKIERVAQAAARSGWLRMPEDKFWEYDTAGLVDHTGTVVMLVVPQDGLYRVHEHLFLTGMVLLRKVESFVRGA